MNIYEELNSINNTKDRLKEELDQYVQAQQRKIDETTVQALDIARLIGKNSTFNMNVICPVLADLYGIYTNDEYKYVDMTEHVLDCSKGIIISTNLLEKMNIEKLKITDFSLLEKLNYCIRFYGNTLGMITFYTGYSNGSLKFLEGKNFSMFLKEFIDYVIDYRIENTIKEINESLLKSLECEYLKLKQREIKTLYKEMQSVERQQLKENNARRKLTLDALYGISKK